MSLNLLPTNNMNIGKVLQTIFFLFILSLIAIGIHATVLLYLLYCSTIVYDRRIFIGVIMTVNIILQI